MTERIDADDISWEPTREIAPRFAVIYEDRRLKWWERVRMWFTRRDPRALAWMEFGE